MTKKTISQTALDAETIAAILRQRATHQTAQKAYTFVADDGTAETHLTYGALDRRARAIAAQLQHLGAAGERVLLLYPPGLAYVAALYGCFYAAAVAVPAYPPRLNRPMHRLQAIVADAQATVVLTTTAIFSGLERRLALLPDLHALHWLATDELPDETAGWQPPTTSASTLAILQYTSGSTGTPKGVMLSHGNLLHNLALISHGFQATPADVGVIWLPGYHDMGLIGGILEPMYVGMPVYLMSPVAFLQRPLRWLQAISRYGGTISGGPNFAYELCLNKITEQQRHSLDLSCWRVAFCGAEPVRPQTLTHFSETFAPYGFRPTALYPCYGLAEGTLIVSGGQAAAAPVYHTVQQQALAENSVVAAAEAGTGAQTLVGCGHALQEVVIAHPEKMSRCPPGEVGEIWVSGPSVAQGYWQQPLETERTFQAHLAETAAGPFLRTGDMGFLHEGELFVTGRLKDLIIIYGRNHYPHDIEHTTTQSHPALRPNFGAAFTVEIDGQEQLVIVHELSRQHWRQFDGPEISGHMRQAIAEHHDLQPYAIALLKPLSLPLTSSGKIQRHRCREQFLAGDLKILYQWRAPASGLASAAAQTAVKKEPTAQTTAGISAWLVAQLAARSGLPPGEIDVRRPFTYYGLSSAQAVSLAAGIEAWLGRPLSPTVIYDYPTITQLARHLAAGTSPSPAAAPKTAASEHRPLAEPIAITGIGCRFPGAAGVGAFWHLLRQGTNAVTEIPPQRKALGTNGAVARRGGFLAQVDRFDFHFFGISPREAVAMDPQQRLLLEVAWEALADAGIPVETLAGSHSGVFVGICGSDYGRLHFNDPGSGTAYAGTGNALSIAANRLSYAFDLRGPSIAIDTACSSSLVAVHLACQSLRSGESTLALAGGVNILLSPSVTANLAVAGFLSPDGNCKAFDAAADGYVRGEGAGIVVLKPLSQALADGDTIYALIGGSATRNDGRSNGLTAPNRQAQEAVLRAAYAQAQVSPEQVSYIEAHGTGTALGDPIEVEALGNVLANGRSPDNSCLLGSVKTNIGHLEAAAGIAGLIKCALALKYGEIPPSLHFQSPNPHIPFARLPLRVQQKTGPWPAGPRVAGVSSFGFGGTNAHVVLVQAPEPATPPPAVDTAVSAPPHLLPLSAHTPESLRTLAHRCLDFLEREQDTPWPHICYSAGARRSHHDYRLALVAASKREAAASLRAFLQEETQPGLAHGRHRAGKRVPLVFVFSGQGAQWWSMGRQLLAQEPVFRAVLQECDQLLATHVEWSLLAELQTAASHQSRLGETAVAQPVLFALQVALVALWRHWGIVPDAVVGHSMGEVAAAYVAGVLSLAGAIRVIAHRGRLLQAAAGGGKMAVVALPAAEAEQAIAPYRRQLSIAAINSPTTTVLSGEPQALAAVLASLKEQNLFCRELPGAYAFHSVQMEPYRRELERGLAGLETKAATLPIFSTMMGSSNNGQAFGPSYWQQQIREPVRFAAAVDNLIDAGYRHFLEIGPHPELSVAVKQCLHQRQCQGVVLPSLRRQADERATMLASLATLYTQGHAPAWRPLYPLASRFVPLPPLPWQRERCWVEAKAASTSTREDGAAGHPLLGRPLPLAHRTSDALWQNEIDGRRLSYLADHRFGGTIVLPGAAYLEMALTAVATTSGSKSQALAGIEFHAPLLLPPETVPTVQCVLASGPGDSHTFQIFSRSSQKNASWTLHASGKMSVTTKTTEPIDLHEAQRRCRQEIDRADYYHVLRQRGLEYGPRFQGIRQLWRGDGEALSRVQLPPALVQEAAAYTFHPAFLDACAQIMAALDSNDGRPFLPAGIDKIRLFAEPPATLWCYARQQSQTTNGPVGDVWLLDEKGTVVLEARGLRLQYLHSSAQTAAPTAPGLYEIQWQPRARPEIPQQTAVSSSWLIFADEGGVGAALAARIAEEGHRSTLVFVGPSYARGEDDRFYANPQEPQQLQQLLEEISGNGQPPCRGIVHLWTLDAAPARESSASTLAQDQVRGSNAVLYLLQAMAAVAWPEPPRLWLVTPTTQAVAPHHPARFVSPATIWGLGRTLAQEQPGFYGGLIDLDTNLRPQEAATCLWPEVVGGAENQLAFRGETRYVARLVHRSHAAEAAYRCRPDGSYLITGGLGGLGLQVAQWLVAQGARHLVLMGRTPLPPRATWHQVEKESRTAVHIAAVQRLERLGTSVHVAAVDVADEAQLAHFLDTFRHEGRPPLRGVVHVAGVLQDQILLRLDAQMMAAVFRAKVMGAWLLHTLLQDVSLDFFTLFSSVASVLGSAGQGNYAAANAFLDALAHYRRAQGLAALSINWGPWATPGMATQDGRDEHLTRRGIHAIEPQQALDLWGHLIHADATQTAAMAVDWPQLFRVSPTAAASPLLHHQRQQDSRDGTEPQMVAASTAVLAAPPHERHGLLAKQLTTQVARIMGLPAAQIEADRPLNEIGIDSLMGIELKNQVETAFGVTVPVGTLLSGPTITELVSLLLAQLAGEEPAQPAVLDATPVVDKAAPSLPPVVAVQAAGTAFPFFCVHPGALEVTCYTGLAHHLGQERPFYVLQPPELDNYRGLADETAVSVPIATLATGCLQAMQNRQPGGPYFLGGWSLGGALAFEMARQLREQGEQVALLALFDSPFPPADANAAEYDDDVTLVPTFASYLSARGNRELDLGALHAHRPELEPRLRQVLAQAKNGRLLPADTDLAQIRSLFYVYKSGLQHATRQLATYKPQAYAGHVVYFRAEQRLQAYRAVFPGSTAGWARHTSPTMQVHDIPGDHYTMFLEPHVAELAARLAQAMY